MHIYAYNLTFPAVSDHPAARVLTSDWSVLMVVYGKNVQKFSRNFLSKARKYFFIDNHYKTIFQAVRTECGSCRVYEVLF